MLYLISLVSEQIPKALCFIWTEEDRATDKRFRTWVGREVFSGGTHTNLVSELLAGRKGSSVLVIATLKSDTLHKMGLIHWTALQLVKLHKEQLCLQCILRAIDSCLHILHSYINSGSH